MTQIEMFTSPKAEAILRRMVKREHTNVKGDGICPWCHISGCTPTCDLGRARKLLKSS